MPCVYNILYPNTLPAICGWAPHDQEVPWLQYVNINQMVIWNVEASSDYILQESLMPENNHMDLSQKNRALWPFVLEYGSAVRRNFESENLWISHWNINLCSVRNLKSDHSSTLTSPLWITYVISLSNVQILFPVFCLSKRPGSWSSQVLWYIFLYMFHMASSWLDLNLKVWCALC